MPFYHVWFATNRRRWLLQGDIAERARELIRTAARENGIDLRECETMVDHVHLLLKLDDTKALSRAMNLIKGISSRRLGQEFPEARLDLGVAKIWQHRFAAKVVPDAAVETVSGYIRTQWDRVEKLKGRPHAPAFRLGCKSNRAPCMRPRYENAWLRLRRPSVA